MKYTIFFMILFFVSPLFAVEVVANTRHALCQEFQLNRELNIYKDPSLFLSSLSLFYVDPMRGWESLMNESPLLTTLKGAVHLMKLEDQPHEFKNFGAVARIYELADRKFLPQSVPQTKKDKLGGHLSKKGPMIYPVKICNDAYADSLGFVLDEDLRMAQVELNEDGVMPPSTRANKIPRLRESQKSNLR